MVFSDCEAAATTAKPRTSDSLWLVLSVARSWSLDGGHLMSLSQSLTVDQDGIECGNDVGMRMPRDGIRVTKKDILRFHCW